MKENIENKAVSGWISDVPVEIKLDPRVNLMEKTEISCQSTAYLLCPLWLLPSRLNRLTPRNQSILLQHSQSLNLLSPFPPVPIYLLITPKK